MLRTLFLTVLASAVTASMVVAQPILQVAPSAVASPKQLVAEIAQLITQHAYSRNGRGRIRYEARIDTVSGLKLYVGWKPLTTVWNNDNDPDWFGREHPRWYCIDFGQPLDAADCLLAWGRRDTFSLDFSDRVVQSMKGQKINRLLVHFAAPRHRRTADYQQLFNRLSTLTEQLVAEQLNQYAL